MNSDAVTSSGGEPMLSRLIFEEEGQALVEYALIISLIALVVAISVKIFQNGVNRTYSNIDNKMILNTSTQ
jgi:Flp pilus assembly pilin Flp